MSFYSFRCKCQQCLVPCTFPPHTSHILAVGSAGAIQMFVLSQTAFPKRQYCLACATGGTDSMCGWLHVTLTCGRTSLHSQNLLLLFKSNSSQLLHLLITKGTGKTNNAITDHGLRNLFIKILGDLDDTPKF